MAQPLRFVQLSDVHFGARLGGGRLSFSENTVRVRRQERRDALARAVDLVAERDGDGLLVPGDLFDDESIDTDTLRFVLHQFERLAPRPVFVAPGNHDPYGGASPYRVDPEENARGLQWPENVILFAHEEFRTVAWPGRDDVNVTGCGVAANVPRQERRLAEPIGRKPAQLEILLFHGSRDDGGWLQAHKSTHPFTREELLSQGFDWVALGHYHEMQILYDENRRPRAAYSGSLTAGGLDEKGEKGCLVVELSPDHCNVEQVVLDPRQIHRVVCELSGAGFHEEAQRRVEQALQVTDTRAEDIVLLELGGRRAAGLDLGFLDKLSEHFFHFQVDSSGLRPDVDLEAYPSLDDASTTEERFVASLRERLDEDATGTVRRALLYGLDALGRGRIDTRYEE